ncbi:MAG: ABC transporter ATP-binding protein [Planctomycetota bacterium]
MRIGQSALANKGLVIAAFTSAFLAAFFTKGPFLLLKPFTEVLVPTENPNPEAISTRFTEGFNAFSAEVIAFLGIQYSGDNAEGLGIITVCVILSAIAGIFGGVAIYFALTLSRTFAAKVVVDLRNEVAQHILQLPLRFFGRRRMGDLLSNMTNNTAVLARSFTLVADHAILDPLHILINIGVLSILAPQLLWIFIPALPLMALPIVRLGRRIHRRSGRTLAAMGDATESLNQMLQGIKTVKAFQLEQRRFEEFRDNNNEYLERTKSMLQAKGRSQGLVFVAYQVIFAGMLLTFGWIYLGGALSLGDMAAAGAAMTTSYTHVKRLSRIYNTMMESLGAMDAVDSLLNEEPELARRKEEIELNGLSGEMKVEGLHFSYGDEPVLSGIEFMVEKGSMVALVGPSGGGKSTTIDLLARFYDPVEGRILIDGIDLKDVQLRSYRERMALVSQSPFLFNTTVMENILYGRPSATRAEVEDAAKAAQIHDFIETLPKGYDTRVGERGSNLSGGQMQRVTIARAILRDPAILFLDEATSSLDSESEGAVQKALANLMRGRTSFVIAHRLSTIREADLILVMDKGKIVQRGRHDELLTQDGLYRRLIELQKLG